VEPAQRGVEDRPRDERRGGDEHSGREHDPPEPAPLRPPVGELAAEPVAEREVDEDEADDVRPDDGRGAEVRGEQARRGDLGRERTGAGGEDDDPEPAGADPLSRRSLRPRRATDGERLGRRRLHGPDDAVIVAAMCFELDSLPPIPALSGAAVSHRDLVLEAADGNRFAAFEATPDEPGGAAVVVLPDVRGLYRFYEELALRFAERGIAALAIDYFGRTAGVGK